MDAYRLLDWGVGGYAEVPVPEPGPGEILLKVAGAGLCRSDLHFLGLPPGGWPVSPPWTLGHENTGWVASLGPGAERFSEGDAVLATGIHSCGRCEFCLRGADNYCRGATTTSRGAGVDGGLAPFVVVPERELVALTTNDPARMSPLADAGHTSYGAVNRVLPKLRPGTTAVVIGAGGLGSYAIQYLRLLSDAQVIAVDRDARRLEFAREVGAHETLSPELATPEHIRELTRGQGATAVLDFVVDETTMLAAMQMTAMLGSVVLIGMGSGSVPFAWGQVPPLGCEVLFIMGATLTELQEVVSIGESGKLRIEVERFAFDEIDRALDRLRAGDLLGRAVVLPNGGPTDPPG